MLLGLFLAVFLQIGGIGMPIDYRIQPRLTLSGDLDKARELIPQAKLLLFSLKERMKLGNLMQLQDKRRLDDGSEIFVQSVFGIDQIRIGAVGVPVPVLIEEELVDVLELLSLQQITVGQYAWFDNQGKKKWSLAGERIFTVSTVQEQLYDDEGNFLGYGGLIESGLLPKGFRIGKRAILTYTRSGTNYINATIGEVLISKDRAKTWETSFEFSPTTNGYDFIYLNSVIYTGGHDLFAYGTIYHYNRESFQGPRRSQHLVSLRSNDLGKTWSTYEYPWTLQALIQYDGYSYGEETTSQYYITNTSVVYMGNKKIGWHWWKRDWAGDWRDPNQLNANWAIDIDIYGGGLGGGSAGEAWDYLLNWYADDFTSNFYVSHDKGVSWNVVHQFPDIPVVWRYQGGVSPDFQGEYKGYELHNLNYFGNGHLLAGFWVNYYYSAPRNGFYVSDNYGASWVKISISGLYGDLNSTADVRFVCIGDGIVFAQYNESIESPPWVLPTTLRSEDYGASWIRFEPPVPFDRNITCIGHLKAVVSSGSDTYITKDGGKTWKLYMKGDYPIASYIFMGSERNGIKNTEINPAIPGLYNE